MSNLSDLSAINLAPLFPTTYLGQRLLPAVHPGQASWVWAVKTTEGERIVRTSRWLRVPDEDFWQAALRLFQTDTSNMAQIGNLYRDLRAISAIPIPEVLAMHKIGTRTFLILENLPGYTLTSFNDLPNQSLAIFGKALAQIHNYRYPCFGPLRTPQGCQPVIQFHTLAISVMAYLVTRYYSQDRDLTDYWAESLGQWKDLPPTDFASPIMLDMDPTQFLTDGTTLTGMVDIELYVSAPRHLELIGLEYLLDQDHANAFRVGYETIMPLPPLEPFRKAYRLLLRLMSFQGSVDWHYWMNAPIRFEN